MSIEKITSKIISDAEESAAAVRAEAVAKCDEIIRAAEEKASEILAAGERRSAEDKEKLITRKKSVADIDGRKMLLETKQKLIGRCFDAAVDKIVSLEKDRYIAFLTDLVKKTGEKEGELILNPADRSRIGEELISALGREIEGCRITLSLETRNIRGGFLLKKGLIYMNGTVETLIEEAREELAGEVASKLFR